MTTERTHYHVKTYNVGDGATSHGFTTELTALEALQLAGQLLSQAHAVLDGKPHADNFAITRHNTTRGRATAGIPAESTELRFIITNKPQEG